MCPGPPGGGDDPGAGSGCCCRLIKFELQVLPSSKTDVHLLTNHLGQVDHPYSALLEYTKCLKGNKAKLQIVQVRGLW